MRRERIPFEQFHMEVYSVWADRWFLLTCGDYASGRYNAMTIGWGSIGRMWQKPFVHVVVRPSRYTFQFMNQYDTFTLCVFPPQYQKALQLLGSESGRDGNKIARSGLTPIASQLVAAPGFDEAELIIECRKIYWQDFDPAHFLDPNTEELYPSKDYHRAYFGEIMAIFAADACYMGKRS